MRLRELPNGAAAVTRLRGLMKVEMLTGATRGGVRTEGRDERHSAGDLNMVRGIVKKLIKMAPKGELC